ncbi:MotA/TolQ/ExbB proton channel family protein [Minicystis rosea]|nr:MotA/TolQ/ExbB proton channel family protein [Minicystis rosea]
MERRSQTDDRRGGHPRMVESIKNVMVRSGASWVLWLLFALSVVSIAIMIERARVFWSRRDDVATLVRDLHRLLGAGDLDGALMRLERSQSTEATVALAGLSHWESGAEAAAEAMAAASGVERARFERRLLFLGTLGNNAPFIGLLGTVIGVVGAFDALGSGQGAAAAGQLAPERVMGTIAEALVATAVGLIVAIPAVAVFNHFQGLLTTTLANAETLGHVVLAHIRRTATLEPPTSNEKRPASSTEHPAHADGADGATSLSLQGGE